MKGKRIISSLLSMAMVFTLNAGMSFAEEAPVPEEPVVEEQPVEEPAVVEEQPVVEEETVVPKEQQPVQEEPAVETQEEETKTEEPQYPAQTFTGTTPNGTVTVNVTADEGSLPAGTKMYVYDVNNAEIEGLVDSVISGTRKAMVAVNIIFEDKDGNEIEPLTDVTITIDNTVMPEMENKSLVHINQDNEVDVVQDYEILEFKEEKVVFTTDVFSIYAIVGEDTADGRARMTYHFEDRNGDPFLFLNNAGQYVDNQILKDGEILQDVGLPEIDPDGEVFNGWYYYDKANEQWGEKVTFDKVTVEESGDLYIRPKYGDVHYLTFYEDVDGNAVYTNKQVAADTSYDISNEVLPPLQSDLVFVGWTETKGGTKPITDTTIKVNADKKFYPVYKQAYWITFVSSQTGSGAQYIKSEYVLSGEKPSEPEEPTWLGWDFDYWSTVKHEYEGTGPNTRIVNDGKSGEFKFDKELNENITLYAYWQPADVTYKVVYWKQNVTDDKNATVEKKTYSFFASETSSTTVKAGSRIDAIPSEYTTKGGSGKYFGFKYNKTKTEMELGDGLVVDATGATVLNIYYDREIVTMQFGREAHSVTDDSWWNDSSKALTYTGLYEQDLSKYGYRWDSTKVWKYYMADGRSSGMSFLGQFILPNDTYDSKHLTIRFYPADERVNHLIEFYLEPVTGTWSETPNDIGTYSHRWNVQYVTFGFSDKYQGFTVSQYRRYKLYSGEKYYLEDWKDAKLDSSVNLNRDEHLEVRYKRIEYTLKFLNPITGKPIDSQQVKYGASLADIQKPTFENPPAGKQFNGKWYDDSTLTKEFNWASETMPCADKEVFAGLKDIWYWIKVDPNGGVIASTEEGGLGGSTWFFRKYGEMVEEYGFIQRDYVESTSSDAKFIYQYDEFREDEYDPDTWEEGGGQEGPRTAVYVEGFGNPNYRYEDDAYSLIGWYEVDKNSKQIIGPYDFSQPVTDNVYLRAMWRRQGDYKIKYISGEGSDDQEKYDPNRYADGSDFAVAAKPNEKSGYRFIGWSYEGEEEPCYKPGDVLVIDGERAGDNKTITFVAQYENTETVPVKTTHINFYSNNKDIAGLNIEGVADAKLYKQENEGVPYNEAVNIPKINDVVKGNEYKDFEFLGWAKADSKGSTVPYQEDDLFLKYDSENDSYSAQKNGQWVEVTQIGADENEPIEDLYAVWKTYFTVIHTGKNKGEEGYEEKITRTTATYDLTKNITPGTLYGGYYLNVTLKEAYSGTNYEWGTPETNNGKQLVPAPKETYYIKEVPEDYLRPNYQYTYSKKTKEINDMFLFSVIDDLKYNAVGFDISTDDTPSRVYKSVTIKVSNGDTKVKFTPTTLFPLIKGRFDDSKNYVSALNTQYKVNLKGVTKFTISPYWITPDGVKVNGAWIRNVENPNGKMDSLKKDDIKR